MDDKSIYSLQHWTVLCFRSYFKKYQRAYWINIANLKPEKQAEIGFWIGKPYWSKGYCSEAAKKVIDYVFEKLDVELVYAECMHANEASSKVLKNLGMKLEKTVITHIYRINQDLELDRYAISNCGYRGQAAV